MHACVGWWKQRGAQEKAWHRHVFATSSFVFGISIQNNIIYVILWCVFSYDRERERARENGPCINERIQFIICVLDHTEHTGWVRGRCQDNNKKTYTHNGDMFVWQYRWPIHIQLDSVPGVCECVMLMNVSSSVCHALYHWTVCYIYSPHLYYDTAVAILCARAVVSQ